MRPATPELIAFLSSRTPCFVADLFTWTLLPGGVYRWSSFDRPLSYGGNTWLGTGPLVSRNRLATKNTVEIPELELRLAATDQTLINTQNIKTQIHNGVFDGARVELDRVFMPTPGDTSLGPVLLFNGRQSSAIIDAEGVTLTAKGDNVLMNQQAPRNLYQTTCLHTFCDSGCALLAANYTITGAAGERLDSIQPDMGDSVPATPALFTLGKLTMTGGAALGAVRTVRLASSLGLWLTYPLYNVPAPGDTFSLLMGCDRQQTSCQTRTTNTGGSVNNIQHFRGYPYIPVPEIGI